MTDSRELERNKIIRESSAEHLARYLETDGEEGYYLRGAPILILTTIGRRSGEKRSTPLMFGRDGDNFILVGSLGGAQKHPFWYLNLSEHPDAEVQVKADKFPVRARTATGEEREGLWRLMVAVYSTYAEYQTRTDREIPIIVLEPRS